MVPESIPKKAVSIALGSLVVANSLAAGRSRVRAISRRHSHGTSLSAIESNAVSVLPVGLMTIPGQNRPPEAIWVEVAEWLLNHTGELPTALPSEFPSETASEFWPTVCRLEMLTRKRISTRLKTMIDGNDMGVIEPLEAWFFRGRMEWALQLALTAAKERTIADAGFVQLLARVLIESWETEGCIAMWNRERDGETPSNSPHGLERETTDARKKFERGRAAVAAALLFSKGFDQVKQSDFPAARAFVGVLKDADDEEGLCRAVIDHPAGAVTFCDLCGRFLKVLNLGGTEFYPDADLAGSDWAFAARIILTTLNDIEEDYPEGLTLPPEAL